VAVQRHDEQTTDKSHVSFTNIIQDQDTEVSKVELSGYFESEANLMPAKKAPHLSNLTLASDCRKVIYECPCCPCVFTELETLSRHLLPHKSGRNKCSNLYTQQAFLFQERSTTEDTERSKNIAGELDFRDMLEHYIDVFKKSRSEGGLLERLGPNESKVYKSLVKPKLTVKTKRTFKCSHCTKVFSDKATCIKHLLYH